jgi:hypothetical protein
MSFVRPPLILRAVLLGLGLPRAYRYFRMQLFRDRRRKNLRPTGAKGSSSSAAQLQRFVSQRAIARSAFRSAQA